MITEVGIADPGVGVLARDSVNLVAVTALLAVELKATGEALHLKHSALNAARKHGHSLLYDKLCQLKFIAAVRHPIVYKTGTVGTLLNFYDK